MTITVNGGNDGPVLDIGLLNQNASQDSGFSYQVPANSFSDQDGDALSYSATLTDGSALPAWLAFDAGTRTFSGTPGNSDVGSLSVRVTASDGVASTDATFTLAVGNVNDPAVIAGVDTGALSEDSGATLTASGTLTINDPDSGEAQFAAGSYSGLYGTVALDASGNWTYRADNSQSAIQSLGDGDTLGETVIIQSVDGTNHTLTLTVTGSNDGAVISGTDSGSISEDSGGTLTVSGALSISDVDSGEAQFTAGTVNGSYGDLTVDANGNWSYSADNSQPAIQALGNGDTLTDTLTVSSLDGTAHTVTITVNGSNDGPVLDIGLLNQNASQDSGFSYQVPANSFSDQDGDALSYSATLADGSALPAWLAFDAGTRTFSGTPGNSDVGSLSVRVTASDGVASTDATFTLAVGNVNDPAVMAGVDTGALSEDSAATLTASGTLTISDPDSGEAQFAAGSYSGLYGTVALDASGNWTYSADNSQPAIQSLGDGDTLGETVIIQSVDGTNHTLTLTVTGSNDGAVISGTDSGSISEDSGGTLTVSGALSISDVDSGEARFTAGTVNGSYGDLTLDANGNWSYSADNSQPAIQALGDGDTLTDTLTVSSLDGTAHTVTITVNGGNDGPVLDIGLLNQNASQDSGFSYQVPANSFSDQDGDALSYSATLTDGSALPAWLAFDAGTRTFSGTPGNSDVGSLSVRVTASDGVASTDATFTLAVGNVNDPAVIAGVDTGALSEDSGATLTASGTLTINDPDSGEAQFAAGSYSGLYGTVALDAAGNWTYRADNSQSAIQSLGDGDTLGETVIIQSVDGTNHTLTLTVTGSNDGAVISGTDSGSISEDSGSTLTVSGALSISDVDSGEAQFTAGTVNGSYGDLTLDANGNWSYSADNSQPAIQALGDGDTLTDTLTVSSLDGTAHTVTITVNGSNDGPVLDIGLLNQNASQDSGFSYQVPANSFSDQDGDALSYSATLADGSALPAWLAFDAGTRTFSGTPGNSDVGSLSVRVTASDGVASTDATFTLAVGNVNDPAVMAGVDTGALSEDSAATLTASGTLTISDPDSGEAQFAAGSYSGLYGTVALDASGNWTYSADNSQSAIQSLGDGDTLGDTVIIQSVDGTNHTLTLTVTGSNDGAVISGTDSGSISEDSGSTLTVSGALSVSDVDAGEARFTAGTVNGSYGDLTVDTNGNWSYSADNSQPAIQALGNGDTLTDTLTVSSLDGTTHMVTITVNGGNDGPVLDIGLLNQNASQDSGFSYQVPANSFSDQDGDALSYSATLADGSALPAWLAFDAGTRTFSGTPGNSDVGSLSVRVTASDGVASTDATFTLAVGNVNDPAVIAGVDTGALSEDSGATLTASGTLTISDPDSGEAQFAAGSYSGLYGTVALDAVGNWTYSADNSQPAIQSLGDGDTLSDTVTIQSEGGTEHTLTLTVTGSNDGAVISGSDSGNISEDSGGTLTVSGALLISDVDSGEARFTAGTVNGSYGDLTVDANGNWSYSADNSQPAIQALGDGDTLTDTLTVSSLDGTAHTVTITVNGSNDGPVLDIGLLNQNASQDSGFSYQVPANSFSDQDGDALSYSATLADGSALPAWLAFDAGTRTFSGTPGNSDVGSLSVRVTASDGVTSTDATFTLAVGNVNDPAVIAGVDTGALTEDSAATLTASGTLTISDPDSGEAQFAAGSYSGLYGTVALDASGNWTYSADNSQPAIQSLGDGDTLSDTVTIQSEGGTEHTLTLTVTGSNDGAVISGSDSGNISEDSGGTLTVSGALLISDVDSGEARFTAGTVNGSYGDLTVDANGNWSYSADNSQPAIQALGDGDTLTDTLTVSSLDGTAHTVTITVNGSNDSPVLDIGLLNQNASQDSGFSYQVPANSFSDQDGDALSYSATLADGSALPAWLAFDAGTRTFSGTPGNSDVGSLSVRVTASDGVTSTDATFTLAVGNVNDPAVIAGVDTGALTEDSAATLTASGTLTISDPDSGEAQFAAGSYSGLYGTVALDASGNWTYSADNSQPAIQSLGDGDTLSDTVTIQSEGGTEHTLTLTVTGSNDGAVISGSDSGNISEDSGGTLTVSGALLISDVDSGEARFTAGTVNGSYGDLTVDANGNWSYSADNSQPAIQALGDGDTLTDTLTVSSLDGTAHTVTITVNGSNDSPVLDIGLLNQNASQDSGFSYQVPANSFSDQDGDALSYSATLADGSALPAWLAFDAGTRTFSGTPGNSDVGSLSVRVTASDGVTSTDATFTLAVGNVNDPAVIAGVDTGALTEDSAATLTASGTLTISDPDSGEAQFAAGSYSGLYGTVALDASGNWTYSADNSQPAIQSLGDGDTLSDTVTIQSEGGTEHTLTLTVTGSNDGAVISGSDSGNISEDSGGTLTVSGALLISDVDSGEARFTAGTVNGSYGDLTVDANGNWSYSADNSQPAIQALGDGDTLTDTLAVSSLDGTAHTVTITVNGSNDSPVLDIGLLNQNASQDSGFSYQVPANSFSDQDGDALSYSATLADGSALPAWLAFDAGTRTFSGTPGNSDVGSLSVRVTASDGVTSTDATFTLAVGNVNDPAVIAGVDTGALTEDSAATLTASGTLTISDPDSGEAQFAAGSYSGLYGTVALDAVGNWTYSADNSQSAIQSLGDGVTLSDTVIIQSEGGTEHTLTLTVTGSNDGAVISGTDSGSVSEDSDSMLTVSGALSISDVDAGEAQFTAGTINGSYGDLTLDASGNWSYSADNSQRPFNH
ncbi:VCBS domain-containing protein [Endozoicomonas sp. SCSIO W0465]|uniref:VCBS domain-containing protein n=1 Tax=Endozoicomonas sp. SCSIO W0465 TaxID=2918516 RepID=UPI002075442E|nr:VCBS domain-containing protein [Endozoicomonas sp. SCSIO W0465]USE36989.1 VCBS domain-containing protein [Endozoicomonas sp. SCSIO W0465]